MYDAVDRLRHWLIKKLACGDMILLNFEMAEDRRMRPRNAGPSLVHGCEIVFSQSNKAGMCIDRRGPFRGPYGIALQIWRHLTISSTSLRALPESES